MWMTGEPGDREVLELENNQSMEEQENRDLPERDCKSNVFLKWIILSEVCESSIQEFGGICDKFMENLAHKIMSSLGE